MTNNERLYVDIHVLQTVPPSCVNRDDTGSPKTAVYGGVTRARVSSQAWKHAVRLRFRDTLCAGDISQRTSMVVDLVADEIASARPELSGAQAQSLAQKVLEAAGIKIKEEKDKLRTDALFFISPGQISALAEAAIQAKGGKPDKKVCQEALKVHPGIDLALFGRMVALKEDGSKLNVDAAAQVAHAISTHAVENEYDYFTAVDDCSPEDNTGAGHVGTVEFNSSTLYRYANVNVMALQKMLGQAAPEAVGAFIEAFIRSMPTGKQNTFANWTRPDAVYVTVRRDQPINMAGAFEKAVRPGNEGYVRRSVQALADYAKETYGNFASAPALELTVGSGLEALAAPCSVNEMLDTLVRWLKDDEAQK